LFLLAVCGWVAFLTVRDFFPLVWYFEKTIQSTIRIFEKIAYNSIWYF
jgi:hypothetical protein